MSVDKKTDILYMCEMYFINFISTYNKFIRIQEILNVVKIQRLRYLWTNCLIPIFYDEKHYLIAQKLIPGQKYFFQLLVIVIWKRKG